MAWLILAIASYVLFGITAVIDKFLLTGTLLSPKIYAFITGILGALVIPAIFFVDVSRLTIFQIAAALIAGIILTPALLVFYESLKRYETSRVMPIYGGLMPIFILLIVLAFFGDKGSLSSKEILALVLLIIGSVSIAYKKAKFSLSIFILPTVAAIMMALAAVLTKVSYEGQSFISALIFIRIGCLISALVLLIDKEVRDTAKAFIGRVLKPAVTVKKSNWGTIIFFINQALVVIAGLMQNIAVYFSKIKYVTIINAMAGIQYVCILVITIFLSRFFPDIIREDITKKTLITKTFSVTIIIAGLALLAF